MTTVNYNGSQNGQMPAWPTQQGLYARVSTWDHDNFPCRKADEGTLVVTANLRTMFEDIDHSLSALSLSSVKQAIRPCKSSESESKEEAAAELSPSGTKKLADQGTLETVAGLKAQFIKIEFCLIKNKQLNQHSSKTMTTVERLTELLDAINILQSISKLISDASFHPEITALEKLSRPIEQRLTITLKVALLQENFNHLNGVFRLVEQSFVHDDITSLSKFTSLLERRLDRELYFGGSKTEATGASFGSDFDDSQLYDDA